MKTNPRLLLLTLICVSATLSFAGPNEDLIAACRVGDVAKAKAAIDAGADVNLLTGGNSPLASAFFWPEVTRLLLDKGADPNRGDFTPLMQAVLYYSTDVVKILLDAGADPNKPAIIDPSNTFKTLIENEKAKGKDANKAMIKAWESAMTAVIPTQLYPLHNAVLTTSCTSCVEMLLAKGAKLNLGVTDGTLLHTFGLSYGKSRELFKQAMPAVKTSIAPFGFTKFPDWYSADMQEDRFGSADKMLKLLLDKGLNINEKNKGLDGTKPRTPLELALNTGLANVGGKEILLALISNGADVKIVNETFGPLIFQAAQTGLVDVVKAMVEKGADINADGRFFGQTEGAALKGYTPLTIAAYSDHLEMVKYLIGAGAKTDIGVEGRFVNAKTFCVTEVEDKTAIYYAIENGNVEMVKFMVEADVKWWKPLKIHERKKENKIEGQYVTITFTYCFDAGQYLPSAYLAAVTKDKKINAKNKIDETPGLSQEQKDGLDALKPAMKAKGI